MGKGRRDGDRDGGWSLSEAFLTTVVDGMREDILLLDATGRVVDCNRSVIEHLGQDKEDIIGLHCRELQDGDFCRRDRTGCPFARTVATGRKADAVHTRLDDSGRLEYYRVYTYPLFDDDGELSYVVEMRRDITRRTHTEQRLQQAHKMAAIGELSTYIAHEIRNPLFAIGGFARSLLRDASLGEEARGKVNIILEEARRLDGILKAILNYAKPTEAGAGEVDLNIVAGETVQLMGLGCGEKNVQLETLLTPGLAQARGEPELLKQCLINMVKNSMEAMGQGGGRIVVTTGMEGKLVFVRVDDDGPGIPDDVKLRVFNPFFSTKDEGSGLGLAMTRKIVEDVGGSVRLVSQVGEGTSVTIYLRPALAVNDQVPEPGGYAPSYEMSIFGAAETLEGENGAGGSDPPGPGASAPEGNGPGAPGPLDGDGATS